jgi:hypothetical protein
MPQLDLFTFFPQIFWGFLLFFVQFFLVSYYFLPLLASSLKFKQKYLATLFQNEASLVTTNNLPIQTNANLLLKSLKELEKTFANISNNCDISTKNTRINILTNLFNNLNYQITKIPFLICAIPTFYRSIFNFKKSKKKQTTKIKKTKRS